MTVIDRSEAPVLAAPRLPQGRLSFRQFLRVIRDNTLASFPPEDFDADILVRRLLWRRTIIVNEPGAIRHVLLDNASNYIKTELTRRLLEPGLGRGLLTTEGETWRRHRRIMAPSFDPRSVAGYAPIMTEVTQELIEKWDALADGSEVDVAGAMMHATLHIISRAMFSADSDEIVDVVERGVNQYQMNVRPQLVDLLNLPRWLARLITPMHSAGIFNEFDKSVDRLLNERGRQPDAEPKDLLARLIAARDDETGSGMTAKEVRDQVVTIFMAGHETTAQTMAWTWYLLSQHPAVEAKLHAELAAVLGRRTPRQRRPRQSALHAHGDRRIDAALSAGAHLVARAGQPRRSARSPHPRRRDGADRALDVAPQAVIVGTGGSLRAGAIFARARGGTAALCLYPVRCGSAHLHRRSVCARRGDADPGDNRPALPAAAQARFPRRAAGPDHAAAPLWTADAAGTAAKLAGYSVFRRSNRDALIRP